MILVKKHITNNRLMLALCDKDIFGKKYIENSVVLDLNCDFYNGLVMPDDEIKELIKKSYIVNAAGIKSINLIKELNLIDEKNILFIEKIPHAQILITINE
ncbi:MAG: DUF424 family protein [Nanoarchaeota archaeon]